jgi:hypothetical protein
MGVTIMTRNRKVEANIKTDTSKARRQMMIACGGPHMCNLGEIDQLTIKYLWIDDVNLWTAYKYMCDKDEHDSD